MKKLTIKQIQKIFRRNNLDKNFCIELSRLLELYKDTFKINTPIRRVRFLAQAVHEVGVKRSGKIRLRESLNYSPKGLMDISLYFRLHPKLAYKYARTKSHRADQKAIANIMYDDKNRSKRLKLGNKWGDDGYKFRGMFMFQTTGRYNATKDIAHITKMTGIVIINPETKQPYKGILDTHTIFIIGGMAHWHRTKMYKLKSTNAITNKINKGLPKKKKKQRLLTAIRLKEYIS